MILQQEKYEEIYSDVNSKQSVLLRSKVEPAIEAVLKEKMGDVRVEVSSFKHLKVYFVLVNGVVLFQIHW